MTCPWVYVRTCGLILAVSLPLSYYQNDKNSPHMNNDMTSLKIQIKKNCNFFYFYLFYFIHISYFTTYYQTRIIMDHISSKMVKKKITCTPLYFLSNKWKTFINYLIIIKWYIFSIFICEFYNLFLKINTNIIYEEINF